MQPYQDPPTAIKYLDFLNSANGQIQQRVLTDAIFSCLPKNADAKILDAACGPGWLSANLKNSEEFSFKAWLLKAWKLSLSWWTRLPISCERFCWSCSTSRCAISVVFLRWKCCHRKLKDTPRTKPIASRMSGELTMIWSKSSQGWGQGHDLRLDLWRVQEMIAPLRRVGS